MIRVRKAKERKTTRKKKGEIGVKTSVGGTGPSQNNSPSSALGKVKRVV